LKIGDHIIVKGTDDGNLPYQATIVDIFIIDDAEEEEEEEYELIEIQPLRNDNDNENDDNDNEYDEEDEEVVVRQQLTRMVHIDEIQLYRPVRENDSVWALSENPYTGTLEWKTFEVLFVTPFGMADILLTQKFFEDEEDDEDAEEFENEPVTVDIRDFYLIDSHVPVIRLRQY